jgi:UrcA family protein
MSKQGWGIAVALAAFAAGSLGAQGLEEVIVEASPMVKSPSTVTQPDPGYYKVALSSRVSYADLVLTKPADAAILEKRIHEAAQAVCTELGKAYPQSGPDTPECAKRAAEKAMVTARKAIADAELKAKK